MAKRRKRGRRYVALGRELKRRRQGLKLLQKHLIAGIYENESQWRSLERGECRPDREKLIGILVERFGLCDLREINRVLRLARYEGLMPREIDQIVGDQGENTALASTGSFSLLEQMQWIEERNGSSAITGRMVVIGYMVLTPDEASRFLHQRTGARALQPLEVLPEAPKLLLAAKRNKGE